MEIYTSVRNLVEFILRSGDLDNRRTAGGENAMQEGSRIHRLIQRSMGSEYHPEVFLKYVSCCEKYDIVIEGRADGIIEGKLAKRLVEEFYKNDIRLDDKRFDKNDNGLEENDITVIDEIKGTYRDIHRMKEAVPVHLAQAMCYAFFYASQNNLNRIYIRMTYCNLDTEDVRYFFHHFSYIELQEWFNDLIGQYRKWADYEYEWNRLRKDSILQLQFPFDYRDGQKELVSYVYQTIYHKKKLFIEAPTGVGKTISTVFPAVKAVGEGLGDKIFYLTAKTITRTVAEEAFSLLRTRGLKYKTVILTAKEKICFMDEVECNPLHCPFAKGHYDRINEAIYDLLIHEQSFTRELIEEYAHKHNVCPFEMCLDMSLFSDGIICDYNYVFDPHVYLRRFFSEGTRKDHLFLIDEAHNLLDRGREMYSAVLRKEDFLKLKKIVKEHDFRIYTALEKCNKELLLYKKECTTYQILQSIDPFVLSINRLAALLEKYLEDHDDSPVRKEVLDFYFEISHFLLINDKMDDNYVIYSELEDDGSFILKLFCVNPSVNLQECMMRGRSSILFSATLLPIQYYKSLLGGTDEDYEVYAKSVFHPDKRALMIGTDVTSKYTRRNAMEFYKIASYIKEIVSQRQGNYMIFFPSYTFLQQIYEVYEDAFLDETAEECILQEGYMNEASREEFLMRFAKPVEGSASNQWESIQMEVEEDGEKTLLGFCVLGGIFSEGIDLKNDRLIGAIIVGTGLPQVCNEREIMKQYFDEESGNGFDYSYQYPGMNKVLQAAGRVIRTVDDVGIVALLDERFLQRSYQRMFPRDWEEYEAVTTDTIGKRIERFWNQWL